jgi:hypothetical protein
MPPIPDKEIIDFAELHSCRDIIISRPVQTSGKRSLYVSFTCKCGNKGGKDWKRFKLSPVCKICAIDKNPRLKDDEIKEMLEINGHEFVSSERDRTKGDANVIVNYICECDKNSTRVVEKAAWDALKTRKGCPKCRKEKLEISNMEKYGVKHSISSGETREKIKETMLSRYGSEHPSHVVSIREKFKRTMLSRYGVENPSNVAKFQEKKIQTCLEKYGVMHHIQDPDVKEKMEKKRYKLKTFTMPSGKVINCRGYEPFAIQRLLEEGVDEIDIYLEHDIAKSSAFPKFMYEFRGSTHRYFPDIYDASNDKFIEVKSEYTNTYDPEKILAKIESVKKNNYDIEIWIFSKTGELLSVR